MFGGLYFKVLAGTVFFAISQRDGLGWLAVAGSIGFLFCQIAGLPLLFACLN